MFEARNNVRQLIITPTMQIALPSHPVKYGTAG